MVFYPRLIGSLIQNQNNSHAVAADDGDASSRIILPLHHDVSSPAEGEEATTTKVQDRIVAVTTAVAVTRVA
jgi:hypothetical protein